MEIKFDTPEKFTVTSVVMQNLNIDKVNFDSLEIVPEYKRLVLHYHINHNGEVLHRTKAIEPTSEEGKEIGFWINNKDKIESIWKFLLQAFNAQEVTDGNM